MRDWYLVSDDLEALNAAIEPFKDKLGPVKGRAATDETVDEFGFTVPAQEAVGDPLKWYACVRVRDGVIDCTGCISECDPSIREKLLGVWANGNLME